VLIPKAAGLKMMKQVAWMRTRAAAGSSRDGARDPATAGTTLKKLPALMAVAHGGKTPGARRKAHGSIMIKPHVRRRTLRGRPRAAGAKSRKTFSAGTTITTRPAAKRTPIVSGRTRGA
jgi:hypothetical protein